MTTMLSYKPKVDLRRMALHPKWPYSPPERRKAWFHRLAPYDETAKSLPPEHQAEVARRLVYEPPTYKQIATAPDPEPFLKLIPASSAKPLMDTARALGEKQPYLKRFGQAFSEGIVDLRQNVDNIGGFLGLTTEDFQRKKQPLYKEVPSGEAEHVQTELSELPRRPMRRSISSWARARMIGRPWGQR